MHSQDPALTQPVVAIEHTVIATITKDRVHDQFFPIHTPQVSMDFFTSIFLPNQAITCINCLRMFSY